MSIHIGEQLSLWERTLPDEIRDIVSSMPLEAAITTISQRYQFSPEMTSALVTEIGGFVTGTTSAREFLSHLIELNHGDTHATTAFTRLLLAEILIPLRTAMRQRLVRQGPKPWGAKSLTKAPPPHVAPPAVAPPKPATPPSPARIPPPPPPPLAPQPAAPAPRPIIMPPVGAAPHAAADPTEETITKYYRDLPPVVRDAMRGIPITRILYDIGREHQLTVEQTGKMADAVMQFVAGKANQDAFLDTLLDIFGGFRQKSAAASQEINTKIFSPIRKALKTTTLESLHAEPPTKSAPAAAKPGEPSVPTASPAPHPKPSPSTDSTPSTGSGQTRSPEASFPRPELGTKAGQAPPVVPARPAVPPIPPPPAVSRVEPPTAPSPAPKLQTPPPATPKPSAPSRVEGPREPEPWIIYPLRTPTPRPVSPSDTETPAAPAPQPAASPQPPTPPSPPASPSPVPPSTGSGQTRSPEASFPRPELGTKAGQAPPNLPTAPGRAPMPHRDNDPYREKPGA
ncbi:hypothetical protein C4552_01730 [Candidatus Parcubacteria bacterium]|nr:MAG: hypothetical protein C4552_01730 [Candidatus Parcubacteria bacterium]